MSDTATTLALRVALESLTVKANWAVWSHLRKLRGLGPGQISRQPETNTLATCAASNAALAQSLANETGTPAHELIAAGLKFPDRFLAAYAATTGTAPPAPKETPTVLKFNDPPTVTPAAIADDSSRAALLERSVRDLLGVLASQKAGIDEPAVRAIVDTAIAPFDQRIRDLAAECDRLDTAIKAATIPTRVTFQPTPEAEARDLGVQHKQFPRLLRLIGLRLPNGSRPNIWITGPAGSGKTHAAHVAADALTLTFYPQGSVSAEHILFGFIDAGGRTIRTPFRDAWELGGVFCLDEADGCDPVALLALNAALANGSCAFPDGIVKRHADTVIIATANTWGNGPSAKYVGRARLDAASLNRFMLIDWRYDDALELSLVPAAQHGWVRKVQAWRAKADQIGANVLITPRASLHGAADLASGATEAEAVAACFGGIDADTRRRIGMPVAA